MVMNLTICLVISVIAILLVPFSLATFDPIQSNYLKCLEQHSSTNHPISNSIYFPQNSSFSSVLRAYIRNERFNATQTPKPLLIVTAMHESHVQATIICSKSHGLMMRTRSGGHDYAGLSYVGRVPFVVLDMFNLRSIDIDLVDKTLWVQSGASLGELYYNIAKNTNHSYGFPAGVCPTVGAGGHFSGGGYGNMMRKYGLSVDNIVDAKIVDVHGNIMDRRSMGEDLFWAIRGGGGSSFGVIVSWKLKLVRVPDTVTVFRVNRTIEQDAINLVEKWQNISTTVSKDLFIRLELVAETNNLHNKTVSANFIALFLGRTEKVVEIMSASFPELGLKEENCFEMSWLESVLYWYDLPRNTPAEYLLTRATTKGAFEKLKSDFVKEVIPKEGLKSIFDKMIELEGGILLKWNPYGGRMSEIKAWETPRPHRAGYLFKLQYWIRWNEEENRHANFLLNKLQQLYDTMTKYVSKNPREAYLNYRDIDVGYSPQCNGVYEVGRNPGIKYFKGNYGRLVKVKTAVDPDNFFRDEQSIPPATIN